MQGVISSKTLLLCRDLRDKKGVKLVLVTGARTSTLLNRLPYLPKADAYCTESGGRIFYPTNVDCCHGEEGSQFTYTPVEYSGSDIEIDLHPFGLREDMTWRKRMEVGGAGTEAYDGNEVLSNRCDGVSEDDECLLELYESIQGFPIVEDEVPINQRPGHLWDFANQLVKMEGFVLDTKSYSTCFRVNKKHQTNGKFDALLNGEIAHPEMTIGKSTNLGCIDFFPAISGKQNCCQYIANELEFNLATESLAGHHHSSLREQMRTSRKPSKRTFPKRLNRQSHRPPKDKTQDTTFNFDVTAFTRPNGRSTMARLSEIQPHTSTRST
eukprot:scaffold4066_cov63-Cyclotella_meneghiniana.AAC.6